ncbi:MAG: DUF1254 domain-containing protein [Alphaproteobacteria bacterium]|nr:DUF1254 domain-containing protein [Alphaproteobacteria bacterium]
MRRRDVLLGAAALATAPAGHAAAATGPSLREAARDAWLYALPLIEMATIRARAAQTGANVLTATRTLATPESRVVTTPNNDTIYSAAWLDLTRGPVTLGYAPSQRYQSVHILNMYTDTDAVLCGRTVKGAGGAFELVGPGQRPRGPLHARVSTPQAWMIVRTLVDGPADLAAAHAAQDGVTLTGPAIATPGPYATRDAAPPAFFEAAQALMAANPPPRADRAFLKRVGLLKPDARAALTPAQWAEIAAGVAEARALIGKVLTAPRFVDGWSTPPPNLGLFGQDFVFRAAIALGGIGALPPDEAIYLSPEGDRGAEFTGDGPYRLTVPANLPVSAFWSLTMYEVTAAKQRFLTPNPLARYSIGDRTPGLVRNADGALDIWISRTDPGEARRANWLPAPAQGPFTMSFRAYWPKPDLVSGRVRLPRIVPA